MYEVRVNNIDKFSFHHTPNIRLILYKVQLLMLFRETIFVSLVWLPLVAGVFPLFLNVQTGSEGHSDSYSVWYGALISQTQRPEREVSHSLHPVSTLKMWGHTAVIQAHHTQCPIIVLARHTQCTIIILARHTQFSIIILARYNHPDTSYSMLYNHPGTL
jgi:hypothetical protein